MEPHEVTFLVFVLTLLIAACCTAYDISRIISQLCAFTRSTEKAGIQSGNEHEPSEIAESVKNRIGDSWKNHYVVQRLKFAIDMVLPPDKNAPNPGRNDEKNSTHAQLPSVGEWYALDVEKENSRLSVCISRTLIASLLIMGIVGTIYCLHHGYIADINSGKFGRLHEALQPSLWAIGGTIILLILRGTYRTLFERLESRINRYTLEVILPCLQMPTHEEELEDEVTQAVDDLNSCIRQIANNFDEYVSPFINEIGAYKQSMEKLLDVLGNSCDTVAETAKKMEGNSASSKKQAQQIRDAYQKVLPTLRKADGHLTTIPNRIRDLLKSLQDLQEITDHANALSSTPLTEVKKIFSKLRQRCNQAQPHILALRTHDQQSLPVHILNETKALKTIESTIKSTMPLMEEIIELISILFTGLRRAKSSIKGKMNAQLECMKEGKNKLQDLKDLLDARRKHVDRICSTLHRRHLAYRKRPWLFLNRWDLLASSLLSLLLILKLFFF